MSGRPYVMDTGWVRGIHNDLDGEALYRWAKQLEARIEKQSEVTDYDEPDHDGHCGRCGRVRCGP